MKNSFNFTRFLGVTKSEILINYKIIVTFGSVVIVPFLIMIVFKMLNYSELQPLLMLLMFVVGLLSCLSPFILYKNMFHRIKGVSCTMLPASNTEKFLSMWLLSIIVVPLFLFLVLLGCLFIVSVLYNTPMPNFTDYFLYYGRDSGMFAILQSPLCFFISCQAIPIWGICFFRTHKLRKTTITLVSIGTILVLLMGLLVRVFGASVISNNKTLFEPIFSCEFWYIVNILFVIGLWTWAYIIFKRQQV